MKGLCREPGSLQRGVCCCGRPLSPDTIVLPFREKSPTPFSGRLRRKPSMKRWVFTVATLLTVAGLAHAEYVIIVANVGQAKAPPPPNGGVGFPGQMGPMG